ncbi:MAG: methyltransferase [Campylobacterota bacterium]|nr:methyltransferase [Campylobacterota bacterium]
MIDKQNINKQFSQYANEYNNHNIIQQIVSKALVRDIDNNPKRILELGCGSGQIFKNIDFNYDYYKAIDFSRSMCDIHPKASNLDIFCLDFDDNSFIKNIENEKYDMVISSSALQWSKNLDKIIYTLSKISNNINMALFTLNTFQTIFKLTDTKSPILDEFYIKKVFSKYYNCIFEIINYKLEFENKKKMFEYIKKSGVSGETNKLSFQKAKYLYKNYDLNYLEFEVIFIKGKK